MWCRILVGVGLNNYPLDSKKKRVGCNFYSSTCFAMGADQKHDENENA